MRQIKVHTTIGAVVRQWWLKLLILPWCWWWAGWLWSVELNLGGMRISEANQGGRHHRSAHCDSRPNQQRSISTQPQTHKNPCPPYRNPRKLMSTQTRRNPCPPKPAQPPLSTQTCRNPCPFASGLSESGRTEEVRGRSPPHLLEQLWLKNQSTQNRNPKPVGPRPSAGPQVVQRSVLLSFPLRPRVWGKVH